jgi:hypothetical protein
MRAYSSDDTSGVLVGEQSEPAKIDEAIHHKDRQRVIDKAHNTRTPFSHRGRSLDK